MNLTLEPSEQCSPRLVQQQVDTINSMSGSLDSAAALGQTVAIRHLASRLPVLDAGGQQGVRRRGRGPAGCGARLLGGRPAASAASRCCIALLPRLRPPLLPPQSA